ncbi:MAG: hypothetical protein EXR62_13245, partial [Chloroflexi bacterium]|nr:hypothetical protein [Chloroflexota bacterium]
MMEYSKNQVKSINWGRQLRIPLVLLSLLLLAVASPAALAKPIRAQAALLQMAAAQPGARVAVIVQKQVRDQSVEELVTGLGGLVTNDLSIINAFVAEIPAGAVPELAKTEGVRWVSLDAPVSQSVAPATFVSWASTVGSVVVNGFTNATAMVDSTIGPNATYGYGGNVVGSFADFEAEITPGNAISKVEVVLRAYAPVTLNSGDDPKLTIAVGGVKGSSVTLNHHAFDTFIGAANAGTVYVDMTSTRSWQWSDFDNGIEVIVDQGKFGKADYLYYDAIGLRVTSIPGNDPSGNTDTSSPTPDAPVDASQQLNVYNSVIGASQLWNTANYVQGKNVTVAVVDSGVATTGDLKGRIKKSVNFNQAYHDAKDLFGHGTFVAGIVAGNGANSQGKYIGVAPKTNLLNVRVSDDNGGSTESAVVGALQWILQNKQKYNIRVVNLSLNSTMAQSYHTSPLDAALEILWFNKIVVVVSAGNNGTSTLYPPANDPFVITVGATDDKGTATLLDDAVASFSAYGVTPAGAVKPDLVAPGKNIIGYLPENNVLKIGMAHPVNRINTTYFKMSGTSMAAPMVSGAVALLLQAKPTLTPDQVKYVLKAT